MRSFARGKPSFRSFAGIAASIAIVSLLFDEGTARPEYLTLAYAIVAGASPFGAFLPSRPERGEVFRLERFRLTSREAEFVHEFIAGKTMKEIAIDHSLSFSTVRNTFSSVYEKLGVSGGNELYALGALYKIE
jgi:DNA-binding CsgD family transcriptional regulator